MKKKIVMNTFATLTASLLFCLTANAQQGAPKVEAKTVNPPVTSDSKGSDKVDLKKLEDKYWSAKDEDYGVIQNRTFSKKGKFYASLVYGPLINDSFAKSRAAGGMLGYYLNEDFGVELSYLGYDSKQNDTVSAYETQFGGVKPDYNLVKSSMAASIAYTPFYAKMAFMNKGILYFDMGFTLGAGVTSYEIQKTTPNGGGTSVPTNELQSAPHFEIGVMQQLFLSQYFAFRLDIKNSFYTQKIQKYQLGIGLPESSRGETSKSVNDTTISFGLTLFTK